MHRTAFTSREDVLGEIGTWLETNHRVKLLGSLGFENAYALAMRRDRAEALGIHTIEDLARQSANFSIAADVEFFVRPEWRALQQDYGLHFMNERQLQATFMYRAVADGEIDVIAAYSSDGQIAQYDLVLLDDPKRSLPPYDAVILLAPGRDADRALTYALMPLLGAVTVERMRQANLMVSGEPRCHADLTRRSRPLARHRHHRSAVSSLFLAMMAVVPAEHLTDLAREVDGFVPGQFLAVAARGHFMVRGNALDSASDERQSFFRECFSIPVWIVRHGCPSRLTNGSVKGFKPCDSQHVTFLG